MISPKLRLIREKNRIYSHVLKWLWKLQGCEAARAYMFHSVVDAPELVYSEFAITKDSFERFIKYELARGQKPMDAETLKKAVDNPGAYKNHFVVTFDDIYDSAYRNAYPVLKAYNVPFIIFISPSLIGRVDSASHHPMITMEHLLEIAYDPLCIIGAHGMAHAHFRNYKVEEAMTSMTESKRWLEHTFGKPVDFFAYPFGRKVDVSGENIHSLSNCGYHCAFSALNGSLKQKWFSSRWFLPRILVDDNYVMNAIDK